MSGSTPDKSQGDSGRAKEIVNTVQNAVTSALQPIGQKLQTLERTLENIDQNIHRLDERTNEIKGHSERMEGSTSRELGGLTTRLCGVDRRCVEVDQRLQELGEHLGHFDKRLDEVGTQITDSLEASYQAYNIGCGSGFTRPFKPIPARIITSSPNTHTLDVDTQSDNVSDSGRTVVVSPVDHGLPHLSNVEMINQLRSDQLDLYLTFYNIQNDESLSHEQKVDKLKARIGCNFSAPRKDGSGAMIMVWCTIILLVAHWYF